MITGQLLMGKIDIAWSYESLKFDSSQTYIRLLLLLPEPSEVISNFIRTMYFCKSKSSCPTELDLPLTSVELNDHPQDFLSSSSLHSSPRLSRIQRRSENSRFISRISKESVSWECRSLRIERLGGGAALKLLTAALDYFCRNSLSSAVFESVSSC